MIATGFAICDEHQILVRTASDTERAAKVNWLVLYGRVYVADIWTDEMIDHAFENMKATHKVEIKKLFIETVDTQ
jgi:hypothetical protein